MTVWNCFKYFFSSKIEFICFLTSSWLHSRWKYNWDFQTRYDHTLHGSLWHFDIFLIIDSVSSNVKDFYQNNSPIYLLKRTVNLTILIFNLQENCSCLDNAAILFINTNLLLEYRANWRFLFSTETHGRSLEELASRVCYKGPTILVVKDAEGKMFGAHASTSWCNTEGGWVGNGEFLVWTSYLLMYFMYPHMDKHFHIYDLFSWFHLHRRDFSALFCADIMIKTD